MNMKSVADQQKLSRSNLSMTYRNILESYLTNLCILLSIIFRTYCSKKHLLSQDFSTGWPNFTKRRGLKDLSRRSNHLIRKSIKNDQDDAGAHAPANLFAGLSRPFYMLIAVCQGDNCPNFAPSLNAMLKAVLA